MEKMPYRPELDVHDVRFQRDRRSASIDDDHARTGAQGLPVLDRRAGHAARAARVGCAVALRAADDRGSVALHLAAADARSTASSGSSPGRCVSARSATYACFAVTLDSTDTAIGIFQLRELEPGFGTAEWGFAIGSAYWGTGVFQEGAELMVKFAFETVGVHRLEARAAVQNGRGNGALRKIGAVQEGLLRKSFLKDGEYLDQALWTILDEDWQAEHGLERARRA